MKVPFAVNSVHHGGTQKLYRFLNNYGASVVRNSFYYGHEDGLWELAVVTFPDFTGFHRICYDTPITSDVIGYLTETKVEKLLNEIENLPKIESCL